MIETRENQVKLTFDDNLFSDVIEYIYTGEISLLENNIKEYVEISSYLQITPLLDKCDKFITEYLPQNPSSTIITILYDYEISLKIKDFSKTVNNKLELVFTECIEKYVFLIYSYDEIKSLLINNTLKVENEYNKIKALILWFQYDIQNRVKYVDELFILIKIPKCANSLMIENKNVKSGNSKVDNTVKRLNISISIRDSILNNPLTVSLLEEYQIDDIKFDKYIGSKNIIIKSYNSLYKLSCSGIYKVDNNELIIKANLGKCSIIIYTKKKILYVFNYVSGIMLKVDPLTNIVSHCEYPINYKYDKDWPPTISEMYNGNLIVIGGSNSVGMFMSSVLIYNTDTNTWSLGPSLPEPLVNHATLSHAGDIYVFGGNTGLCSKRTLRLRDNVWTTLSPMPYERQRHVALVVNETCLILGGSNSNYRSVTYDIPTDTWTDIINSECFKGVLHSNSVYDKSLLYVYDNVKIYTIALDGCNTARWSPTKCVLYENIKKINTKFTKFVLMICEIND